MYVYIYIYTYVYPSCDICWVLFRVTPTLNPRRGSGWPRRQRVPTAWRRRCRLSRPSSRPSGCVLKNSRPGWPRYPPPPPLSLYIYIHIHIYIYIYRSTYIYIYTHIHIYSFIELDAERLRAEELETRMAQVYINVCIYIYEYMDLYIHK